ncbi:MAG: hypothetical protein RR565_09020 [Erysipelothrix sp.]
MFFKKNKFTKKVYYEKYEQGKSRQVVELSNTKGLLKYALYSDKITYKNNLTEEKIETDFNHDYGFTYDWRFNNLPLVYVNESSYCTTESMIMHGHGNDGLENYFKMMNSNLLFGESVNQLDILLSILEDGFYEISEIIINPTDGNGKLFWDIKNYPYFSNVTSCEFALSQSGNHYISPNEYFLFPSQFTSKFDSNRVDYYCDLHEKEGMLPYIITLSLPGNMILCLDGHHKAVASVKLGKLARGINIKRIYPYRSYKSGKYYLSNNIDLEVTKKDFDFSSANRFKKYSSVSFPQMQLNTKKWTNYYPLNSFPTYFESQVCNYLENPRLSMEIALDALLKKDFEYIEYYLTYARRSNTDGLEKLLMSIIELDQIPRSIIKEALSLLTLTKNNKIEEYMINLLINEELDSEFKKIILSYW